MATISFVPGIYNYCDRRCQRCRFCNRCRVYQDTSRLIAEIARDGGTPSVAEIVNRSIASAEDALADFAATIPDEHFDPLAGFGLDAKQIKEAADRVRQAEADPLVATAREYGLTAWRVSRALRGIAHVQQHPELSDAVSAISEMAVTIATKTFRAVVDAAEPDFDPDDRRSDADGSAKIARILIAESQSSWRILMEVGKATADGVPAALVKQLQIVDDGLAQRFPNAMMFVRPGFDTET